jgi:hypothetical protein
MRADHEGMALGSALAKMPTREVEKLAGFGREGEDDAECVDRVIAVLSNVLQARLETKQPGRQERNRGCELQLSDGVGGLGHNGLYRASRPIDAPT